MPLEYEELEPIIKEIQEIVKAEIIRANMTGTLELILDKYEVEQHIPTHESPAQRGGIILVLGDLRISKTDIDKVCKIFKVSIKSFKFIGYDEVTNYNFKELIANTKYTDIFVGAVPHKAMNIGNKSGVLEYLLKTDDITAKVIELRDNSGELKITKKTFKKALEESNLMNMR